MFVHKKNETLTSLPGIIKLTKVSPVLINKIGNLSNSTGKPTSYSNTYVKRAVTSPGTLPQVMTYEANIGLMLR